MSAHLTDVDIRHELRSRPPRARDHELERQAFAALAAEMTTNPPNMLQKLVELALDLCLAESAVISLREGDAFRWVAVAGILQSWRGRLVPRGLSPSIWCVDQNAPALLQRPDRLFPALYAEPRINELLLIPFHGRGQVVGTVWVVSHSCHTFDREDERTISVLADFASAGLQLSNAYDAAAEASHRKDEFFAVLGHELRNPLAAMTAAAAVLHQEVPPDSRAGRAADVVARQCRHLARLADDLLDAGRVATGKLHLQVARVNLAEIVSEAIETCRPRIDERSQGLTVDLPDAAIWIDGDGVRLTQAFCNLIDNAAKYTERGGRIAISAYLCETQVEIAISDTGQGIRGDQMHLIFEPFAQLSAGDVSAGGGLGLGLSLVRTVAELHGGTVTVQSDGPQQGSRFTVRLPLQAVSI